MTEKNCKKCKHYILPENSGFGGGKSTQTTGRCALVDRIIRRMSSCPVGGAR